jgi:hypothetical protein
MPHTFRSAVVVLSACLASGVVAQESRTSNSETEQLARGWALLAKGDAGAAASVAAQVIARNKLNASALTLAVDAELSRSGPAEALGTYETWLGSRRVDEPYVLRAIARGMLVAASTQRTNARARLEALSALAADGDLQAAATLEQAAATNSFGETRELATLGNEGAVKRLIAQLQSMPGGKATIIEALGSSRSKLAIEPLKTLLSDASDINRAAAAEALGKLGARDAIPQLQALLKDRMFSVKLKAAGALYLLGDSSGLPFLMEAAASEHAAVRVAAARELSAQPDENWKAMVRVLANDPDPVVRLEAARLIAPYDPALARTVLDGLMRSDNVGLRESASSVLAERVAGDFATLRGMLRSGDVGVRALAAGRILELTR